MATFTSQIFEILTLNGDNVGSSVTQTINNINYVDNRILSVPTGSVTTLFSMDSVPGAGTFVTSSVQYVRVTNNSAVAPVKLIISSSTEAMSYLISTGSSYMLSTSKMTGSTSDLVFDDIKSVKVQPSGSAASIEYYIVTT
jgi:hypothetical protein